MLDSIAGRLPVFPVLPAIAGRRNRLGERPSQMPRPPRSLAPLLALALVAALAAPASAFAVVLTRVVDPSGYGDGANRGYRGTLELTTSGGKVKLINRLGVDGYVYGVIPLETGYTWGEATKAQAVAARGYALTTPGELACTTYSQVYGGYNVEKPEGNAAADATYHEVVFANDPTPKMIRTYFFSSSGGHTENVENVWGGSSKSYLIGVDDPYETEGRHIWKDQFNTSGTRTYDGTPARVAWLMRDNLASRVAGVPAVLTDIVVTKRGVSGKAMAVDLIGTSPTDKVTLTGGLEVGAFADIFGWGSDIFYPTSFRWDTTSLNLGADGTVRATFHVSPADWSGKLKGLVSLDTTHGVVADIAQDVTVTAGVGEVVLTQPGEYGVDGLRFNDTPDDLRGTDSLFRNRTYPLTVGEYGAAAPAPHASEQPVFQFTGRGNGHGVGMSQWGAKGMAEQGWDYRKILGHYYTGSWVETYTGTTTVRVNLDQDWHSPHSPYTRLAWTLAPVNAGQRLMVNGVAAPTAGAYRFQGVGDCTSVYEVSTNALWQTLRGTLSVSETGGTAASARWATSITIRTSATSVRNKRPFELSGVLAPGKVGDPCAVEVRKPYLARWSYSSARLAYSVAGADGANWWYRYKPKLRGTYTFRVRFAGDASRAPCLSPNTVAVKVR
jgi:peptidoglycan hydrolase-like amidase